MISKPDEIPPKVKEPHPLDEATYRYKSSLNRIKYLNGILSKKSLGRVYNAMMEFPLSDKPAKFRGLEDELFMLTLTAQSAKEYILDFVINNQEELNKIAKEVKEERIEETYVK
jgi:hypothetical protein